VLFVPSGRLLASTSLILASATPCKIRVPFSPTLLATLSAVVSVADNASGSLIRYLKRASIGSSPVASIHSRQSCLWQSTREELPVLP
jgi:hypothetical protein